jgi:GAF domain-containing protein
MRRGGKSGGKPASLLRRKAASRGRGVVAKPIAAKPKSDRAAASLQEQLDRKTRELHEALEQQKATADVLRVINSSSGELQPVFQTILKNATRLCEASFGSLARREDNRLRRVAIYNAPPRYVEFHERSPILEIGGDIATINEVVNAKKVVHTLDVQAEDPSSPFGQYADARTLLLVPMLKENEVVGVLGIYRQEVRAFTDEQIGLVENFAAQAVIAIENTRLLNELQQRTGDLSESLEQQTATAEVLSVISSSPGELEPVFQAMLENAVRICDAKFGNLLLYDGSIFKMTTMHGAPAEWNEYRRRAPTFNAGPKLPLGRLAATKRLQHVTDARLEAAYVERDPIFTPLVDVAGARTALFVPMLKENTLVGALVIYRQEVRPFTDKQIELVQNFAAQAVIAIENTRLLNELRQSLEQQTATAHVLKVISSSPGELEPVFQAMLENATRICEASFGSLALREDDHLRRVAIYNAPPKFMTFHRKAPLMEIGGAIATINQVVNARKVVHILDVQAEDPNNPLGQYANARTLLLVPLLKDNDVIGVFGIYRQQVRAFTDEQIGLVQNFAAQAVIAIENARLLNELRQSLERQTATADVLRVISSSPGELEPVFSAMLENATRICDAKFGILNLYESGAFRMGAMHNVPPAMADFMRRGPIQPGPNVPISRMAHTKQTVHVADIMNEQAYIERDPVIVAGAELGGYRTILAVPMLKDNELIGGILIFRQEVRPFTDKQIALVTNFASQAVIAIENTRLLSELRQRTGDLSESLEQQTAISEILRAISNSPNDVQPVLDLVAKYAARICDAQIADVLILENNMFRNRAWYGELARPTGAEALPLVRTSVMGRTVLDRAPVHVEDLQAAGDEFPLGREFALKWGHRTILGVPLLREDRALGSILVRRNEVRPFEQKHIVLLETFAEQAAIAIENARLLNELRQRTNDLSESLEQQTATSEVLSVISRSPGELDPVFRTILENATRICDAKFGMLWLSDNGGFRSVAVHGVPPALAATRPADFVVHFGPEVPFGRLVSTKRIVHVADIRAESAYVSGFRPLVELSDIGGARTLLLVPMLKEDVLVGTFAIYRQEIRPYSDKQIELLQNFAAQAVIAIENTRLLNELRQSLEQQTATADLLKVISSSPGELEPVFNAMLKNASRICEAAFGTMLLRDGDVFRRVARHNAPPEYAEFTEKNPVLPIGASVSFDRMLETRQVVHTLDMAIEEPNVPITKFGRARTLLTVPMIKDGNVVGVVGLYRQEVKPFTDKQIALVENFAAQAVIAIENTRLLNELRQSLQQQTATADVLKIISRSAFNLQAVLNTLVESAAQLCEAEIVVINRLRGEAYQVAASFGITADQQASIASIPIAAGRSTVTGRAALDHEIVHIADARTDPAFTLKEWYEKVGSRTMLGVPLLREGISIGVMVLMRRVVRPFTDNQVALVASFADQAVIAIENVRLFDEIQDKSRQVEEASRHKSQFLANMSHELRTPLNAILGYTELILDNIYGEAPDKMRTVLARIQTNGKHLLGLINDVLDLSKIEAGQLALTLNDYSIKEIVHGVYVAVEPLASSKKLAFRLDVPPNLPRAHGDERRLSQVLLNLVGNAIKFTDEGEVAIKAAATNGAYTIAVRDTGPGIDEADQAKIFEEFQQADSTQTKAKGGTGLGLSIAKRIVEMHGGRLWVESSPGNGSTFSFTVPLRVEQQAVRS